MNKVFSSLISSLKSSLFTKRLSIPRISGLVVGVLSILFAGVLPFSLFLSGVLTFEGARYFGSFMFYGGLAACLYVGLTTKFRADWRIRKQVVSLAAFMVVLMSVFAVVEAPAVNALTPLPSDTGPGNSSAYKFSVPFMEYRWLVAEFRDHTYYALNGSDWNIMTIVEPWQPVAPWAALAENKTALVEQVLSVTDPGKVLLNELSFDYGLVVPENVTVVESLNGLTRQFINSANTQGSPYTVSVDTVNPTYYLAQDSADRFIDEWSSTNQTLVLANVALNGNALDAVKIKSGIIGSGESTCLIGTASEALAAGQLVYYNPVTGKYPLASASANSTIGYGNVWLNILAADADAKTILIKDGSFTLASWSWTTGDTIWVSTTNGALTATYPSATGNQLVSVGQAQNTTEIIFEFPNGFYMEHI